MGEIALCRKDARPLNTSLLIMVSLFCFAVPLCGAQQPKKPFTVADEIGLTLFGTPEGAPPKVRFSPDNKYFAVWSERGRLDLNRVEDSLRFYRSQDAQNFLSRSHQWGQLSPLWVVTRSAKEGPIIGEWRWLPNSRGVAFLQRTVRGHESLVLADIVSKTVEPLTSAGEQVASFDIRDRQHYVYTVTDLVPLQKMQKEHDGVEIVGTGRLIWQLVLPGNARSIAMSSRRNYLRAVVNGRHFVVTRDGEPTQFSENLALSPDGTSLVATLPVADVPELWGTLYAPPFPSKADGIHTGHLNTESGVSPAHQFVLIKLESGQVQSLTNAPLGYDAGWQGYGLRPSWSSDGQDILLPGTFLSPTDHASSRPCVADVNIASNTHTCVEILKWRHGTALEAGYHRIDSAHFVNGNRNRIEVIFTSHEDHSTAKIEYRRTTDGAWQVVAKGTSENDLSSANLNVDVEQAFNKPPRLVARNRETSRIIWDPNPTLKNLDLGQASVFTWKDKDGREHRAGLFKPTSYTPSQRYPLVIQTHGFAESEFRPSGVFPTAFAARALAAAGMVVLQMEDGSSCPDPGPDRGLCLASVYSSVASKLVSDGLVDSERIGIIGFSSTCVHVMEVLTLGSPHIKAASITDGVTLDYLQYLLQIQSGNEVEDDNIAIGAPPFGEGLNLWLKRSPGFNLDKVNAPLLVVGEGPASLLAMWQPYAGLRYLHKPVDLIMLNTNEHILTNPAVRMASQEGSVDWFRFWLKDEEDRDPVKSKQYERWHELRKMQTENK